MRKFARFGLVALAAVTIALPALGSVFMEDRTVSQLLPGFSLTLLDFGNTAICDKLGTYTKFGNADSCTWRLYYSDDGTNFTLIDSTTVRVAADTLVIQSSPDRGAVARRQLSHAATASGDTTACFDSFIYSRLRVTVTNIAVVDTAAFTIGVLCGTEGR